MSLSQEHVRALDQLRTRLQTLANNLAQLRFNIQQQDPIPNWPSLQSSAQLLMHHLDQIQRTFHQNEDFFKAAHAYPTSAFPGHLHHDLLQQLLRKKLEPRVEDYILAHAKELPQVDGGLVADELVDLWSWAGPASQDVLRPMLEDGVFESDFTLKEREDGIENVKTGLKRSLIEDDEDDEEDEEDDDSNKMEEDTMPDQGERRQEEDKRLGVDESRSALPLESALRFMSAGLRP